MDIRMMKRIFTALLLTFALCDMQTAGAQRTVRVEGIVKDSVTGEALPAVAVMLKGTTIGTITDNDGRFTLQAETAARTLSVSYLGYETYERSLVGANRLTILLRPTTYTLSDVVVRPGHERYSRRNPAVDFVRNVIERRTLNSPRNHDFFSYDTYDQKIFAKNDFDEAEERGKKRYRRIDFIFDYIDTSRVSGKPILPLYNEERIEHTYFRRSPHAERRVVQGVKRAGLVELFSEDGITQFIDEVFREPDVFQDNIPLFLQRFVSPLASFGPSFYKYYLTDTVEIDGERCADLSFVPFNSESFGFTGHLFVTLDSTYFVRRIRLNVPKHINLNFVDFMQIEQDFRRTDDGTRLILKNDITVEFRLRAKSKGTYARRICLYRDHSFDAPKDETVFRENNPVMETEEARRRSDEYWQQQREEGKGEIAQTSVDKMMARLRRVPLFYWTEKVANALIGGYIQPIEKGSPVEFGPVNTFISGNTLEGARYRFGGTTTTALSDRFFIDGYMAYGAGDQKLKGDLLAEYSFNKKRNFRKEFPFHYLRAEYRYDINQIGQHYLYTNPDNIFMMLKRRRNDLITYMQKAELSYYHERYNGLGYGITLRHLTEWGTRYVPFSRFESDGTTSPVSHYQSAQMEVSIRWAPNEKFYQSRNYRYPITLDAPIITLTHTFARRGLLGTDHNYNRTELGIRKRFWLSPFGYIDIYGQAGAVWDRVPYPLLIIPNANLSYSIEPESYALMDPMEFIHDRFASWEATYFLNGALLNRIPLLKRLQLREVFAFRGWYGSLTKKNDPWQPDNAGLYAFPTNTYLMGSRPYMELSCGLDNIFKLVRVDYVWRLSYRNHPHMPNSGLRLKVQFSF